MQCTRTINEYLRNSESSQIARTNNIRYWLILRIGCRAVGKPWHFPIKSCKSTERDMIEESAHCALCVAALKVRPCNLLLHPPSYLMTRNGCITITAQVTVNYVLHSEIVHQEKNTIDNCK